MFIDKILKNKNISVSFETFPPKEDGDFEKIQQSIIELAKFNPDFMSVTYGAGGSTSKNTIKVSKEIQKQSDVTVLSHLTCLSSSKDTIKNYMAELKENNIKNILALRGDYPKNVEKKQGDYKYASQLIYEIKQNGDFCVCSACYPEGHPEAKSIEDDINHLKEKVESGASVLITQMFFDNNKMYHFIDKLLKKNVTVPVICGIMPVTNAKQIKRIIELSGAYVPQDLQKLIDKYEDSPSDMYKAGIDFALNQCHQLMENKLSYFHIYTMNKPNVGRDIIKAIKE